MVCVRLLYSDCAGVRRCRVVPVLAEAADSGDIPSVGLTHACMSHPHYADLCCPGSGLSATGESRLTCASQPLQCAWHPGHYMAPADMLNRDGTPWDCCPRSALKHTLARLEQQHDMQLMVGFELEFVLLRPRPDSQGWQEVDQSAYCHTCSLDSNATVLDSMVEAIQLLGVNVLQFHAESAPGQFEIATGPAPALQAADELQMVREAIRGVAHKAGLEVSFTPKPFQSQAGSGCHCHFSLWRGSRDGAEGLSPAASSFVAGLLRHLSALLLWTAPSAESYARLQPNCWSGAYALWGWDNREAPLRATQPGDAGSTNVEYKAFDGTTNPYLALSALVAAGMLGLQQRLELPPAVDGNTDDPSVTGRYHRLPKSLREALERAQDDDVLMDAMRSCIGAKLCQAFLSVRRAEVEHDWRAYVRAQAAAARDQQLDGGGRPGPDWHLCW